jgi:HK97 family phage major capsid protein
MNKLQEKQAEFAYKQNQLKKFIDECKAKPNYEMADREKVDQMHKELNAIGEELEGLKRLAEIEAETKAWENTPASPFNFGSGEAGESKTMTLTGQHKTAGELFVESAEYKNRGRDKFVVELKTTMTTTGGYPPQNLRNGVLVPYPTRTPMVADLIPQGFTNDNAVLYVRESTFTNNAAERAEAAALAESAVAYSVVTSPCASIGHFIPATEEQLADVAGMQSLINDRLAFMVALKEDSEILNGDGNSPNLTGILNTSGIQTQARGSDTNHDALFKAITACQATGFSDPDAIVINPINWQSIRLATGSGSGVYLTAPITAADGDFLWGRRVVASTVIASGTALVGNFRQKAHISRRQNLTVEVGWINDDFKKLIRSVRAVERLSLEVYQATAFCKVTSLN